MDYNDNEKRCLELLKRTDFKNPSKNDIMTLFSQFRQIRPEIAKEMIAQFPEACDLLRSSLIEYRGLLGDVVSSDDASLKEFTSIAGKSLDNDAQSRKQIYDLATIVLSHYNKFLDNPNLSEQERINLLDKELEVLKITSEKDTEIRSHEADVVTMVSQKDSEKRQFNWELVKRASGLLAFTICMGVQILTGTPTIKPPIKL